MSVYNSKKLNRSDVQTGIWRFVLSFAALSAVSFMAVFFFFKSYDTQRAGIQKEVDDYKNLLSRNELLKIQVDSIYQRMSILGLNQVENDIYLRDYIQENVRDARKIMGKDSATEFKHYASLLHKVENMLALKSQIIKVSGKEQIALRDLNECQGKDGRVLKELQVDPSRRYSGRR